MVTTTPLVKREKLRGVNLLLWIFILKWVAADDLFIVCETESPHSFSQRLPNAFWRSCGFFLWGLLFSELPVSFNFGSPKRIRKSPHTHFFSSSNYIPLPLLSFICGSHSRQGNYGEIEHHNEIKLLGTSSLHFKIISLPDCFLFFIILRETAQNFLI